MSHRSRHPLGYTDFWYDAVPAAPQSENIYLETSLIDIMNIQNAIEKVGAERILFGSDCPESDLSLELEKIAMVDMNDEARRRTANHLKLPVLFHDGTLHEIVSEIDSR